MATKKAPKKTSTPDTERYVKEMRRAMVAMEQIAGDTEAPMNQRLDALQRCVDFWQSLIFEIAPHRKHAIEARFEAAD